MGNLATVLDLFQKKNANNSKTTIYVSFLLLIGIKNLLRMIWQLL